MRPVNLLERYFDKYEFTTEHLLCCSDIQSMTIRDLLALGQEAEDDKQQQNSNRNKRNLTEEFLSVHLGYTEARGAPGLRRVIASMYGDKISHENVLVHAGAQEAIFNFMSELFDAQDHIIVMFPGYQSLYDVAKAEVTLWKLEFDDATHEWKLDLDFLKRNIKPNTRAIVVNFPHNPTGFIATPEQFDEIVRICREHNNLYLFSDEVYRGCEFAAEKLPNACDVYENAVSLGVMSKSYGLPGLRIGWICSQNKTIIEHMSAFKDFTSICASAPSEFLSTVALENKDTILANNLALLKENIAVLDQFFTKHAHIFEWSKPCAGTLAFPRLRKELGLSADVFCDALVKQKGVLLLPGSCFNHHRLRPSTAATSDNDNSDHDDDNDHDYSLHFRIGFGRIDMPLSLRKLEEFLAESFPLLQQKCKRDV